MGCGTELARLHTPPDEHYGLPVVVCPGCGLACVRRPRGGLARWHTFLRAFAAARRLIGGGVLLVGLLVLGAVFSREIAVGLDDALVGKPFTTLFKSDTLVLRRLGSWWTYEGVWLVPVWGVAWIAIGLLTGVLFPHWKVRWWLVGMAALTVVWFLIHTSLLALRVWARFGTPVLETFAGTSTSDKELALVLLVLAAGVGLTALVMPAAQTSGRKLMTTKGLRSKRLTRTRKKRSREI